MWSSKNKVLLGQVCLVLRVIFMSCDSQKEVVKPIVLFVQLIFSIKKLLGVFHWGHLVANYEIFECQEQCLQSWLGLVVVCRSRWINKISNMFHISPSLSNSGSGPWLHPPGNCPVLACWTHFLSCFILYYRCSTGADRWVTMHFWRVGTNVYMVGEGWL